MFLLEDPYCQINVRLFCSLARLPQHSVSFHLPLTIFYIFVCLTFTMCEVADIVVKGFDIRRSLLIVPSIMIMITCLGIVAILWGNKQTLSRLYELLTEDFEVENDEELAIKEESLNFTKQIIKFTTLYMFTTVVGTFLTPMFPQILDRILPKNESRAREHVLLGEYFVDEEEYFYVIMCYHAAVGFSILLIGGVTINMAVLTCRYIFALLTVIGYRMENIIPSEQLQASKIDAERLMAWRIGRCVKDHLRILELVSMFNSYSEWLLLLCLVATMISLVPTLTEVTDIELVEVRSVLFASTQMGQFFVMCILGQQMIDVSTTLPQKVYNFRWYECPASGQKLLSFIMLRMLEPCTIGTKGLFILSVRNFGSVIHAAVSYCMVLRQFR